MPRDSMLVLCMHNKFIDLIVASLQTYHVPCVPCRVGCYCFCLCLCLLGRRYFSSDIFFSNNMIFSIYRNFVFYSSLLQVRTKLGSCEPVWNIYNSLIIHGFCYNFMDLLVRHQCNKKYVCLLVRQHELTLIQTTYTN